MIFKTQKHNQITNEENLTESASESDSSDRELINSFYNKNKANHGQLLKEVTSNEKRLQ